MSLKGTAMTDKVLRGKIKDIRQIEDVNALYAEAEELIASANEVIKTEEVVLAAKEATAEAEEAADNANNAAKNANKEVSNIQAKIQEMAEMGVYAEENGDYAKEQGDYAKTEAERAQELIERAEEILANFQGSGRIAYIDLLASNWQGNASLYSQVVAIDGVTANSKIDINPSIEQLAIFHEKDISFVAENEDGVVTVYCVGQKPTANYQMQITITEVITNA